MMCGCGCSGVSVEEGFGYESEDVVVLGEVEEAVAVTSNRDKPSEAELGEVLRHCCGCDTDVLGKIVDRVLAVQQRPDDVQACSISEELQSLRRCVEFGPRRLVHYLRIHIDSVLSLWDVGPSVSVT